jgi:hypothetical protein
MIFHLPLVNQQTVVLNTQLQMGLCMSGTVTLGKFLLVKVVEVAVVILKSQRKPYRQVVQ